MYGTKACITYAARHTDATGPITDDAYRFKKNNKIIFETNIIVYAKDDTEKTVNVFSQ